MGRRRKLPGDMNMKGVGIVIDGQANNAAMRQILAAPSTPTADPEQLVHATSSIESIEPGADITTVGLRVIGDVKLRRDQRAPLRQVNRGEKIDLTARVLTPGATLRIVHTQALNEGAEIDKPRPGAGRHKSGSGQGQCLEFDHRERSSARRHKLAVDELGSRVYARRGPAKIAAIAVSTSTQIMRKPRQHSLMTGLADEGRGAVEERKILEMELLPSTGLGLCCDHLRCKNSSLTATGTTDHELVDEPRNRHGSRGKGKITAEGLR